jgi:cytochrome c oxidase subunit 2
MDDAVTKELILVKGQEYEFKFRSMDVIHSAYFPHFRAQMNTVPGMVTRFKFVPKYTTTEMRKLMNNDKFDYVLLCNKICGAAHSNMQMKITVVESVDEYNKWMAGQKTVKSVLFPESAAPAPVAETPAADSTKTDSTATATVAPVK